MIDLQTETIISLTEAAKLLPHRRRGKRPHVSCIYKWTKDGCREEILESIQIGGTRCTSVEALSRFFERLGGDKSTTVATIAARTRLRTQRVTSAEAELDRAGIQ